MIYLPPPLRLALFSLPPLLVTYPNHPASRFPVSGVVPEDPVVCLKSGFVYERRLVEKHVETTGQEPVTKEEVGASDFLPIKSA